MPAHVFYLDWDRTLYDTDTLWSEILRELEDRGFDRELIQSTHDKLVPRGYTFKKHLDLLKAPKPTSNHLLAWLEGRLEQGQDYLYEDTLPSLEELARLGECRILTYGDRAFQRAKIVPCKELRRYVNLVTIAGRRRGKGSVIASHKNGDARKWILDDTIAQLHNVHRLNQDVCCIRMVRPNHTRHSDDPVEWHPTVNTMTEFIELVKGSL